MLASASWALTQSAPASEADARQWWSGLQAAAASLAAEAPDHFDAVSAIAISAMTRSQVLLDADGAPLRPAILWADTRSATTLPALRDRLPPGHPEAAALNPFHPLARLWWVMQTEPAIAARLAHVLEPKDYLNFCLTGAIRGDPISMARLQAAAVPDAQGMSLLSAAGIDPGVLPPLVSPSETMGHVRPGLEGAFARLAGVPVLAMANDTWASVIGLGAMRPGFAYNLSGTSEVFGTVNAQAATAEGLMTIDWGAGLSQLGGPSQAGGDTLVWLLELLGRHQGSPRAIGPMLDAVLQGPRIVAPLLFLPYLQGERTPYWDADLRGAFIGLDRRHGPADLLYAVMEGVGFLNRIVLERIAQATGTPIGELRFGGGGAASPVWCRIKADILGCDVVLVEGEEHGMLGAAIVAWTMLGLHPDLATAQQSLARERHRYVPDPKRRAHYNRLFAVFREAEAALRPLSHRLANWQA